MGRDSSVMKNVRKYIFCVMPRIQGYLGAVDGLVMASILIGQSDAALSGGVAEVGVYFGRSFYLMALLINKGEKALAIDLFDIDPLPAGGSRQLTSFLEIGKRLNIDVDKDLTFAGNSRRLGAADIVQKIGHVRFFSIDGGHSVDDVVHDAVLAADTISEFGVICFDDFCNPEWPEVTFGIYDFLRNCESSFVPFLASQKKLFVCKQQYHDFYLRLVANAPDLRKLQKKEVILGQEAWIVRSSQLEYFRCEAFARLGIGRLNALFY